MKLRWRLGTIVVVLNVLVFVLPLLALVGLRVYDRQLVRTTEAELIAQGTVIGAAFKQRLIEQLDGAEYGRAVNAPAGTMTAHLDAALDRVRPRAEESRPADTPADPVAAIAGRAVETLLFEAKATLLAGIRIVDGKGIVVASTGIEHGESLLHREEVERALLGEPSSLLRERVSSSPTPDLSSSSREAGWRVFVALPVVHQGRVLGAVVLSRTPITLKKALWEDRLFVGSGVAVLLTLVLVVALFLTATVVRPVRRLVRVSNAIAAEQPIEPQTGRAPEEIQELEGALMRMAQTLAARAQYIKTFAAAVSHEFKTPLTAMRGASELMLDHEMNETQRRKFLTQMQANVLYLDKLVRRLLEMARADTMKPEKMSDEVLDTIVSNLVENAHQHAPGAQVTVKKTAHEIVVEDDGPGISEANAQKIFQPFFTTNRANGGTGLGLTIVKTLVEAHGGSIALERLPKGTRFVIRLP